MLWSVPLQCIQNRAPATTKVFHFITFVEPRNHPN